MSIGIIQRLTKFRKPFPALFYILHTSNIPEKQYEIRKMSLTDYFHGEKQIIVARSNVFKFLSMLVFIFINKQLLRQFDTIQLMSGSVKLHLKI